MNDAEEKRNQKLIDALSFKEHFVIDISSNCNENGEIEVNLNPAFRPKREASFRISLVDFATTNLIANVDTYNNKFYYSVDKNNTVKVATIPIGFYSIKGYNIEVQNILKENKEPEGAIAISINESTGIVNIKLNSGYSVLFDKENTFKDSLGFDSEIIENSSEAAKATIHLGKRICRLWPTQRIYVHCSAVKGNKKVTADSCINSDIIFRFPCNKRYGAPFTFQLSPRITESDLNLSTGELDRITIYFRDDNNKPITFGRSQVDLSLRISQV